MKLEKMEWSVVGMALCSMEVQSVAGKSILGYEGSGDACLFETSTLFWTSFYAITKLPLFFVFHYSRIRFCLLCPLSNFPFSEQLKRSLRIKVYEK